MLPNSKTTAFLATTHADLAREFYQGMLGLSLLYEDDFALVFKAGETILRLQKVEEFTPQPFTVLGWDVMDIEASVRELLSSGVVFEHYEWMEQDDLGIWQSPGGARVAWFKDPDGNTLSLSQEP